MITWRTRLIWPERRKWFASSKQRNSINPHSDVKIFSIGNVYSGFSALMRHTPFAIFTLMSLWWHSYVFLPLLLKSDHWYHILYFRANFMPFIDTFDFSKSSFHPWIFSHNLDTRIALCVSFPFSAPDPHESLRSSSFGWTQGLWNDSAWRNVD